MAKIALLFVAAFCLVQIGMSAHIEKRDAVDVEITTQGIIDMFKSGIEKTFSDDNINKAKDRIGEFGTQVKDNAKSVFSNIHTSVGDAFKTKTDETEITTPASIKKSFSLF